MIELMTPLYIFRERHFIASKDVDEELVLKAFLNLVSNRRSSITPEQVQKMK
jgi:hypothetical protein